MKTIFNLSFFLLGLFIFSAESFALTDYQLRKFCKNERKQSICIKKLKDKKTNMQKGYLIEIPVIPFKR